MVRRNGFSNIPSPFWTKKRTFSWHGKGFSVEPISKLKELDHDVRNLRYSNRFGRRGCRRRLDSLFFDGETEHEVACPACTQALLQEGKDGDLEVKQEFREKLKYLSESDEEAWQDHSEVVMAVLENEPGKLN